MDSFPSGPEPAAGPAPQAAPLSQEPAQARQPASQEAPDSGQARQYLDAGIALYNEGRYEESIQYIQYAAQSDPSLWEAYQYLGGAYYALGRTSEAVACYEQYASASGDPAAREWVDNFKQQVNR